MRKIILFGPYPPPHGGVAIFMHNLYYALQKMSFDCQLKIYRGESNLDGSLINTGFKEILQKFRDIKKKDVCIDSCSFFFEYPSKGSTIAWMILKFSKRFKWIKIFHDGSWPERYHSFSLSQKNLIKLSSKFVNEFVVVSEEIGSFIKRELKVKCKISVVGSLLPIPEKTFNSSLSKEIEATFKRYDKVVCSIGVFTKTYGFEQIADAVDVIRKKTGLNIGLLLIDGAFSLDKNYKSRVTHDKDWITCLTNIPHSEILQILKKSDLFVRASKNESYGLSRVESIWCGTPVVATPVGETRGMILYQTDDQLISNIENALFDPNTQNVKVWAERFRQEAEHNLRSIIKLIEAKE